MQKIYNELKAPFEKEAYKTDKSRGLQNQLTTIGAQYIADRLNIVFGLGRWKHTGTYEVTRNEEGKIWDAIYYGTLKAWIRERDSEGVVIKEIHVESVGYCEQMLHKEKKYPLKLAGDILKSAKTDSLSKCASLIGIGDDVFKGKVKPGTSPQPVVDPAKNQVIAQIKNLSGIITKDCSNEEKLEFMHNQLEVKNFDDLSKESIDKLNGKRMALEAMAQVVR